MVEQLLGRADRPGLFDAREITGLNEDAQVWEGSAQGDLGNIAITAQTGGMIRLHKRMPLVHAIGLPKECLTRSAGEMTSADQAARYHHKEQIIHTDITTISDQLLPPAVESRAHLKAGDYRRIENVERFARRLAETDTIWTTLATDEYRTNEGMFFIVSAARLAGLAISLTSCGGRVAIYPVIQDMNETFFRLPELGSQYADMTNCRAA